MTAFTTIFTKKESKQLKATAKMLAGDKPLRAWRCKEYNQNCFNCRLARIVEDLESLSEM